MRVEEVGRPKLRIPLPGREILQPAPEVVDIDQGAEIVAHGLELAAHGLVIDAQLLQGFEQDLQGVLGPVAVGHDVHDQGLGDVEAEYPQYGLGVDHGPALSERDVKGILVDEVDKFPNSLDRAEPDVT